MWNTLPNKQTVTNAVTALTANGFQVFTVENGEEAKQKVLELVPKQAEVMTMTSVTLDTLGISKQINESGEYVSVKNSLMKLDRATQGVEMKKMGSAPQWSIGSVHAVTEDGHVLIASASGSQLAGYVYGSSHVVWVVGTQKIVKNVEQGMRRIEEYTLPLESERAHKAYGVPGSSINKLLIVNKEMPGRISIILVNEVLGF